MVTAGIVCEYNPFHRGHLSQFRRTRQALGADTAIVCVMSGSYVQRGEPAVFDKLVRARAAVDCGANLVLELPLGACLSSAEGFAAGGVALLEGLGITDRLSFGCESPDPAALDRAAECLLSQAFPQALRRRLDQGMPFAAARQQAVEDLCGLGDLLTKPNNILAVEYCKALKKLGSPIRLLALPRPGAYHDTDRIDPENPSAAAVRRLLLTGQERWTDLLPPRAAELFAAAPRYALAWGERAMLARLRTLSAQDWAAVPHGGEGLHNRMVRAVREAADLESLLALAATKRYPTARLRRMLLCAYLGATQADLARPITYGRALAFDETGRGLLHRAGKNLPLVHVGQPAPDPEAWALEQRAEDLFTLFCRDLAAAPPGAASRARVYYKRGPGPEQGSEHTTEIEDTGT